MISENAIRAIRDMHMKDLQYVQEHIKSGDISPASLVYLQENVRNHKNTLHLLDLILEELKPDDWYV